ncbi:Hypothetical predicted protein, partial [Mytilus galloprovincialis]
MNQCIRNLMLLTGLTTTCTAYVIFRKQKDNKEKTKRKQNFEEHLDRRLKYVLAGECLYTVSKAMRKLSGEPPFEIEILNSKETQTNEIIKKKLNITEQIKKDCHFLLCTHVKTVLETDPYMVPSFCWKLPENFKKKNIVLVYTNRNTEEEITESENRLKENPQ